MRIVCLSRKECLGIMYIILAVLCFKNMKIMMMAGDLGTDLNIYYHLCATTALIFVCAYFGAASFILHSRGHLSSTFIRFHNVCVIVPLIIVISKTRKDLFKKYEYDFYMDLYKTDFFDEINEHVDANYAYVQAICTLGVVIVIVQAYLVYVRLVIGICKTFRPNK